jgi:hypothetical protein
MIRVYDTTNDEMEDEINKDKTAIWNYDPMELKYPVTNMQWLFKKGMIKNDIFRQRTLLTADGGGWIKYWDITKKEKICV